MEGQYRARTELRYDVLRLDTNTILFKFYWLNFIIISPSYMYFGPPPILLYFPSAFIGSTRHVIQQANLDFFSSVPSALREGGEN